ncbi:hypothetical protein [Arthrobacter glacialis]|uniref:Uncharacterized protein n=1 Tax=Arthrobacter glacialis TaxID=1664 RepID=A0A2S4A1N0_ARTGL|nr:hypothetical protein [Arthrobacter glacialis]POH75284.1 hypothetical protein CVS27_01375 [Arthrobacter glacialis]
MTTATADTVNRASSARTIRDGRAGLPVRLCAAVAVASVGAHVLMAWVHRAMLWESALMLLMAAVCLPCAVAMWRRGHEQAVQGLFVMSLVMVAVHTGFLLGPGSMAGPHHAGVGSMVTRTAGSHPQPSAMLGIVALELAVAMLAALVMRRSRTCTAQ